MLSPVPECILLLGWYKGSPMGLGGLPGPTRVGWESPGTCPRATVDDQAPRRLAVLLGFLPFPKPKQTVGLCSLRGVLWFEVALRQ